MIDTKARSAVFWSGLDSSVSLAHQVNLMTAPWLVAMILSGALVYLALNVATNAEAFRQALELARGVRTGNT